MLIHDGMAEAEADYRRERLSKRYRGEARKDVIDIERKPNHRMVLMFRMHESLVPNKGDGR